jgi:hypothetical protein
MSAIMPPIFFSEEVTQKQATPSQGRPPPKIPRYTLSPTALTPYTASPGSVTPVTKTPDPLPKSVTKKTVTVTENAPNVTKTISVTDPVTKKGRPPLSNAPLTAAEKMRRYRQRRKTKD